jgi:hypothetical protein
MKKFMTDILKEKCRNLLNIWRERGVGGRGVEGEVEGGGGTLQRDKIVKEWMALR